MHRSKTSTATPSLLIEWDPNNPNGPLSGLPKALAGLFGSGHASHLWRSQHFGQSQSHTTIATGPWPQGGIAMVAHPSELQTPAAQGAMGYCVPGTHCRQGDILKAVAQTNKPVWIERGSFLSPTDLAHIAERFEDPSLVTVVDAGSHFGYDDRVLDFRALALYKSWGLGFALGLDELCFGDHAHSQYRPKWASSPENLQLFVTELLGLVAFWQCGVVIKNAAGSNTAWTHELLESVSNSLSSPGDRN